MLLGLAQPRRSDEVSLLPCPLPWAAALTEPLGYFPFRWVGAEAGGRTQTGSFPQDAEGPIKPQKVRHRELASPGAGLVENSAPSPASRCFVPLASIFPFHAGTGSRDPRGETRVEPRARARSARNDPAHER